MKTSKKWFWAFSGALLFVAFTVTSSIATEKSFANNAKIESVAKADCDKCGNDDCKGQCASKCKKSKKWFGKTASAEKSCCGKCGGKSTAKKTCCGKCGGKTASAKKSCGGKKASASTKKVNENVKE